MKSIIKIKCRIDLINSYQIKNQYKKKAILFLNKKADIQNQFNHDKNQHRIK